MKTYPLTPAQNMHYLWIKDYGTEQVSGLSIVSAPRVDVKFDILEKCIRETYKRNGCLRVQFTAPDKKGNIEQYLVPVDTEMGPIELVDLSDMGWQEANDTMQNWAYETMDGDDIPMCIFKMVKLPGGYNGIFLHMDHRLMDSSGLYMLMGDLFGLYAHYAVGRPMPGDPADFEKVLAKDLEKALNPKRAEKDRKFWIGQLDQLGEPLYSDIQGPGVLEESRKKFKDPELRAAEYEKENLFVAVKDYMLEAKPAERVVEFCRNSNISPTNLFLLTMRTYLSKVNNGQEDITIENFVSRRSTSDEWSSGGSRTITFPCRTVFKADMEFMDALLQIQRLQNSSYMHSNYDPALIREEMKKRYNTPDNTTYVSCYLTYQPLSQEASGEGLMGMPFYFKWFANGAATKKLYLTVSHNHSGEIDFSYHYQTAHLTEHDVELMYYYMMRIMFKGIEEPGLTLGEIMAAV